MQNEKIHQSQQVDTMGNSANSSKEHTMKNKHPIHFRSLVLLLGDADYYPFHMYLDESANVNFNAERTTPLRRLMNHSHPYGLHSQPFLWRVHLVTLYLGRSLETTPCPLSLDLNPLCVCVFQWAIMWALLLNQGQLPWSRTACLSDTSSPGSPECNFHQPDNLYFKSGYCKCIFKFWCRSVCHFLMVGCTSRQEATNFTLLHGWNLSIPCSDL